MKILVCISHVPDTTSKINFVNGDSEFDTNGVQFVINPNDEFGLTRAVWFKEQQGATITVVNVGGADAEATLRKALAIGADEAIRINANPTDGMFVAKQLAEVVKNGGYDLVIAGKESLDYNGGMGYDVGRNGCFLGRSEEVVVVSVQSQCSVLTFSLSC
jgi:electron transfer flavoprotein beta subunit